MHSLLMVGRVPEVLARVRKQADSGLSQLSPQRARRLNREAHSVSQVYDQDILLILRNNRTNTKQEEGPTPVASTAITLYPRFRHDSPNRKTLYDHGGQKVEDSGPEVT